MDVARRVGRCHALETETISDINPADTARSIVFAEVIHGGDSVAILSAFEVLVKELLGLVVNPIVAEESRHGIWVEELLLYVL